MGRTPEEAEGGPVLIVEPGFDGLPDDIGPAFAVGQGGPVKGVGQIGGQAC